MNDDEIIRQMISFVEEKEKDYQSQKFESDPAKNKNVIASIFNKVKEYVDQ